jgi:anthranilate synthase/aminodeoxychorismate synthase-like glutamine amidotransferase
MVLLIDNYDSFVYNLARYLEELGVEVEVLRNDAVTVEELIERSPEAIVISPGPCGPGEAGISVELVEAVLGRIPLLGVCLGHQVLAAATGARVVRAPCPVHGQVASIAHDAGGPSGAGLFAGIPSPLTATRYHSLIVDPQTLCADWRVTAETDDGLVMSIEHTEYQAVGVQFHPESVLTDSGHRLLWNFLGIAGLSRGPMPWVPNPAAARGHHSRGAIGGYQAEAIFPDTEESSSIVLHW